MAAVVFEARVRVRQRSRDVRKHIAAALATGPPPPPPLRRCVITATHLTVTKLPPDPPAVKAHVDLSGAALVDRGVIELEIVDRDGAPLTLVCDGPDEKEAWTRLIVGVAARRRFGDDAQPPPMWRHRLVGGTLWAAALAGSAAELDQFVLALSERLVMTASGVVIQHVARAQDELTAALHELLLKRDDEGFLPLHCAAAATLPEGVEWLVEKGADVNATAGDGRSALHIASSAGHRDVVEKLLALGAKPNLRAPSPRPFALDCCLAVDDTARMCSVLVVLLDSGAREELVTVTPEIVARLERLQGPDAASFDFRNAFADEEGIGRFASWFQRLGPLSRVMPQLRQVSRHFSRKTVAVNRATWDRAVLDRLRERKDWLPDLSADTCAICRDAFTFVSRRHHCRWCKSVVCGPCSSRGLWSDSVLEGTIRLCDGCFNVFYAKYAPAPMAVVDAGKGNAKGRRMSLYNEAAAVTPGPLDAGSAPKDPVPPPEKALQHQIANKVVPLGVGRLFAALFDDGSAWRARFHEARGDKELVVSKWTEGQRTVRYLTPSQSKLVNASHLPVTETQTLKQRRDRQCYVVDVALDAEGVPYGDCFVVHVRYMLTHERKGLARLNVSLAVEWRKSTMMKDLIVKAASSVTRNYLRTLLTTLRASPP